jgi:hypothetical protein
MRPAAGGQDPRLKLAAVRRLAFELLVTARIQRWNPEEFLRTLIDAEITARDESNARTLDAPGRVPGHQNPRRIRRHRLLHPAANLRLPRQPGMDPRQREHLPDRPADTGKSHVPSPSASPPSTPDTASATSPPPTSSRPLPRPGDNSVGCVIDTLLRTDLIVRDELGFAPLDDTGAQLLFRFVAAAYERRSLGIGSHWPFESWGRFLSEHTTAVSMLDRLLHHCHVVVTPRGARWSCSAPPASPDA